MTLTSNPGLQILKTRSTYEKFTNSFCSIFLISQTIIFLIIIVASKVGEYKTHFSSLLGIENNAKFGISFVVKIYIAFFSKKDDIFIY